MLYEIMGSVQSAGGTVSCSVADGVNGTNNATISVAGGTEAWITWVGGTEYDINAGDVAHDFSFQGVDPHEPLLSVLDAVTASNASASALLGRHVEDYSGIISRFKLDLGQTPDFTTPTDQLITSYETSVGNSYLEWVLFNFGRYLLVGSSRGVLPANLQGKWASDISNAWSADYRMVFLYILLHL
jgi:alpha-L-fucosidase 2